MEKLTNPPLYSVSHGVHIICVYMSVCDVCVCVCVSLSLSLSLSIYIYIYDTYYFVHMLLSIL